MKLISGLTNIPCEACDQTGRAYTEPVYLLPKVFVLVFLFGCQTFGDLFESKCLKKLSWYNASSCPIILHNVNYKSMFMLIWFLSFVAAELWFLPPIHAHT